MTDRASVSSFWTALHHRILRLRSYLVLSHDSHLID